jgi:hypothetical protein
LSNVSTVAVLDKNISLGSKGAVGLEVKDAMYGSQVNILNYIVGLGGRDIRKKDIAKLLNWLRKATAIVSMDCGRRCCRWSIDRSNYSNVAIERVQGVDLPLLLDSS